MRFWRAALLRLIHLRATVHVDSSLLLQAFGNYKQERKNNEFFVSHNHLISSTSFDDVFMAMGDEQCLVNFRFERKDLLRIVKVVFPVSSRYSTQRNNYASTALLATCVILKRLSTPHRWTDVECLFRKHSPQLSEIFWEGIEDFVGVWKGLVTSPIGYRYTAEKASTLATCVAEKVSALENCIGFIDGTVIEIARPDDAALQNICYNGHKRKHALKFQAVTTVDGMFYHMFGPVEGRRHDWTLYARSELDEQLEDVMVVDDVQYCIYGDSGYNERAFLEIPFQGSSLTENQAAFNKAMSAARITVEWMFKEVKTYWTMVDFPRKMRVLQAPVGSLYVAAVLLSNIRNCFYRNETSIYFNCKPPTLEEYLNWRE